MGFFHLYQELLHIYTDALRQPLFAYKNDNRDLKEQNMLWHNDLL
jgi:hypothetical protein